MRRIEQKKGTMKTAQEAWDWPEELDAIIAAPRHHTLLFENDAVRVLDTRIAPGETVPLHTHRWPSALYLVNWSDFVRRDGAGTVLADSRGGRGAPEGTAFGQGHCPRTRWRMWAWGNSTSSLLR